MKRKTYKLSEVIHTIRERRTDCCDRVRCWLKLNSVSATQTDTFNDDRTRSYTNTHERALFDSLTDGRRRDAHTPKSVCCCCHCCFAVRREMRAQSTRTQTSTLTLALKCKIWITHGPNDRRRVVRETRAHTQFRFDWEYRRMRNRK